MRQGKAPMTAFTSNEVDNLLTAFELACQRLYDSNTPKPVSEQIARAIICVAESGERDPQFLAKAALERLGVALPDMHLWKPSARLTTPLS
jgi:hypothetical protein